MFLRGFFYENPNSELLFIKFGYALYLAPTEVIGGLWVSFLIFRVHNRIFFFSSLFFSKKFCIISLALNEHCFNHLRQYTIILVSKQRSCRKIEFWPTAYIPFCDRQQLISPEVPFQLSGPVQLFTGSSSCQLLMFQVNQSPNNAIQPKPLPDR